MYYCKLRCRYGNGDLYDGYFKEGQRQGHGVYRKGRKLSSASYIYVGEWLNDKRHGYGVMDDILKGIEKSVAIHVISPHFRGNFKITLHLSLKFTEELPI